MCFKYFASSTDKRSELAIEEVIRENFKNHLILGEEGGFTGDASSEYLWCIDPLGMDIMFRFVSCT